VLGVSIEVNKDMKKLIAIIILGMMACFPFATQAGPTDQITATFNPTIDVSILLNVSTWSSTVALGLTDETATDWGNVSNNGDVDVILNVSATDTVDWTIHATTPGHDQFVFALTGFDDVNLTTTNYTYDASFTANTGPPEYHHFGLKVWMPTTSSTGDQQTTTITFSAEVL